MFYIYLGLLLSPAIAEFVKSRKKKKNRGKNYLEDDFQTQYKQTVIAKMIELYDPGLEFVMTADSIRDSYRIQSLGTYDYIEAEDNIRGTIDDDIKVDITDIKVHKIEKGQNQLTSGVTVDGEADTITFAGLFAAIPITLPRKEKTELVHKPHLGPIETTNPTLEEMHLDSLDIEKNFSCYSTNRMLTMMLFTSEVLECIVRHKKLISNQVDIVLDGRFLSIKIYAAGVFEGNKFGEILDFDLLYRYYKYIDFICDLARAVTSSYKHYKETNYGGKTTPPFYHE